MNLILVYNYLKCRIYLHNMLTIYKRKIIQFNNKFLIKKKTIYFHILEYILL